MVLSSISSTTLFGTNQRLFVSFKFYDFKHIITLGSGSFTHNSAGVPIVVTCTKADMIDDGNDMVAGTSGMGLMVNGKKGEWEESRDGIMQVLRTICLNVS